MNQKPEATPRRRRLLREFEPGAVVHVAGIGVRFIGEFVWMNGDPDDRKRYATLWPSRERYESGESWHDMASTDHVAFSV